MESKLNKSYLLNPPERHLQHFLLFLQLFQVVGFKWGSWQGLAEDVIHRGSPEPAQQGKNMSLLHLQVQKSVQCSEFLDLLLLRWCRCAPG